jgi:hypothetical protein
MDARHSKRTELIGQIQAEQVKFDRNEGPLVANLIRIGTLLSELKPLAGRTWTTTARELGYHPRAASRLQKIGRRWQAEIGTEGSERLARLPPDPQKLEQLCRLSPEQLERLLGELDCKKADRKKVADAVKEVLGEEASPRGGGDIMKSISRVLTRLTAAVDRWRETDGDPRTRELVRGALADGLGRLQEALGSPLATDVGPR